MLALKLGSKLHSIHCIAKKMWIACRVTCDISTIVISHHSTVR